MKSYLLKISGRDEGPYTEPQIAQMLADHRVGRYTPCKPEADGNWKTIDHWKDKKLLFETAESLSQEVRCNLDRFKRSSAIQN